MWKNFQNVLGAGEAANARPVLKYAGGDWERSGPGTAVVHPDGRRQVEWTIDAPKSYVDVAFCYPYGPPDVDTLVADAKGYWKADTIGLSQGERPLVRLSNGPGTVGSERPGLYLIARQHSGETPGSWALDGFLHRVAEAGEAAPLVWAVPLSNADGVVQGDYGKDNFPYDLNRAWGGVPMRHESLVIQRDMRAWKARCRPALTIDFHAPGACEASGLYAYLPAPEKFPEDHAAALKWAIKMAEVLTPEYAAKDFPRVARYASRWETPTFAAWSRTLGVCGMSVEVPYALVGQTVMTRERYREAGRRMASAVLAECGK